MEAEIVCVGVLVSCRLVVLLSLCVACVHLPVEEISTPATTEIEAPVTVTVPLAPEPVSAPDPDVAEQPDAVTTVAAPLSDLFTRALAHTEHPLVKKWLHYFTVREHARFQRFLDRGEYYRDFIEQQLELHGLPKELYYLAMIESGFRNRARSRAHAVGIWQFMPRTGRHYGLLVDGYVDERMDPVRSTAAAISYLQDLYRVYQSWWLAIASYNSGEVRVLRAIMHKNTRDFFELVEKKVLPAETVNYVPKFIAAMYIAANHTRFGFSLTKERRFAVADFRTYRVPAQINLREVAAKAGCSVRLIKKHNPAIRRQLVHPRRAVTVRLPSACSALHEQQRTALAALSKRRVLAWQRREVKGRYRVRRGDSLYAIARRFKTSVRALRLANNLHSSRIYAGQLLQIAALSKNKKPPATRKSRAKAGVIEHRVRRGDSLYRIARKYNTSVRDIKRINKLTKSNIYPGQIIKISYL